MEEGLGSWMGGRRAERIAVGSFLTDAVEWWILTAIPQVLCIGQSSIDAVMGDRGWAYEDPKVSLSES